MDSSSQRVKCENCKEVADKLISQVGWLHISEMALIKGVSKTRKYVVIVANKWFCTMDCLNQFLWKEVKRNQRMDKKIAG